MWTRTEAAAHARSDADYAFLSTATSRRREVNPTPCTLTNFTRDDDGTPIIIPRENSCSTQRHYLAAGTPLTHCRASKKGLPRRW